MTLFSAYLPNGQKLGQCDASCYDGTGTRCKCICGGINHGVGLQQAAAQTLNIRWIYHPVRKQRYQPHEVKIYLAKSIHQKADQRLMTFLANNEPARAQC